jgi:hypothetical protein
MHYAFRMQGSNTVPARFNVMKALEMKKFQD